MHWSFRFVIPQKWHVVITYCSTVEVKYFQVLKGIGIGLHDLGFG